MSFEMMRGNTLYPVPGLPLSVFRTWNSAGERHGHDFEELVLIVGGAATQVLYAPGADHPTRFSLAAGDVLWIPRGWSHAYEVAEENFWLYNILFDPILLAPWNAEGPLFTALCGAAPDALTAPLLAPVRLHAGERAALEAPLRAVARELTLQSGGFQIAARAKFAEALVLLERILDAKPGSGERDLMGEQSVVEGAISFIERHLTESITLRDMAKAAHLSPNYFCEVFTRAIGLPPGRFVLHQRLKHARYLLITTPLSITEVARASGFADASYFTRAFKAHFKHTPSELRATGR